MNDRQGKFITFWSFTFLVVANLIVVAITFLLWKCVWLDSKKLTIPFDPVLQPHWKIFQSELPLEGCWKTIKLIKSIITKLEPEYLINRVGYEGYFYFLFVQRLVQIETCLLLLDVCVSLPYITFFKDLHIQMLIRTESEGNAVFRTIHSTMASLIIIYFLYSLRKMISKTLRYGTVKNKNDKELVLEWLKLRTMYLQILFKNTSQTTPEEIRNYLQKFLNVDCQTRHEIYDIVAVPDYARLLSLISQQDVYKTISAKAMEEQGLPSIYSCFSCMTVDKVNFKLDGLEEEIEAEKMKNGNIVGLFLVVDSVKAIQILKKHFYLTSRFRFCRNFELIEEIDYPFTVRRTYSSEDLVWENLEYSRSNIIRQVLFNVLSIMVLVFLSTPAAVLYWIKVPVAMTPYFVIIINSLLNYILSSLVMQQKHLRQSKKEKTECKMLLFYLGMNMIVGSIARNIKNVTDLLKEGGWMWIEVFELVFKKIDGLYYCLLFFNQLTISLVYSLLKPIQVLRHYGWVSLFVAKSKQAQRIFYSENYNFPYAYNFALLITLFIISTIYSLSIPGIHFFSLIFFLVRQYSDTYTLVTFQKKEFESNGDLIIYIIFCASLAPVFHLFLVANSLLVEKQYFNAIFLYVALGLVIFICFKLKQPIVQELDLMTDVPKQTININSSDLSAWKQLFRHPLESQ